jgi:hypothetical protein
VLCAGSTLLLVQTPRHQRFLLAPLPKSASNNLRKWFLSPTGRLNLGFILRENLLLCSSYLPLGVSQLVLWDIKTFSGAVAGEKEDWGVSHFQSSYFVIVLLSLFTLFLFASFYQKYKKISSFYSCYFCLSILVLLEWVLLRTPSCVTLLAQTTMIHLQSYCATDCCFAGV